MTADREGGRKEKEGSLKSVVPAREKEKREGRIKEGKGGIEPQREVALAREGMD